jgi:molybdate transport system permease protein
MSMNLIPLRFMALNAPPMEQTATPSLARTKRRAPDVVWWLSAPLLLFLLVPLVALLLRTNPSAILANLQQPNVLQAIQLSMTTSAISTGFTILLGTPIAVLLARRTFPFQKAIDTLIDLPTVLPPSVAGVALLIAFGRRGLIGATLDEWGITLAFTQIAVVIAQLFVACPFYIKAAAIGFAAIESELKEAAALDGGSRWDIFRHITMPLSWGAVVSGAVMTWARALGEFGATIIFAGNFPGRTQTMPLAIYLGFELDLGVALTLSVILVVCSFLVLLVVKGLLYRDDAPPKGIL